MMIRSILSTTASVIAGAVVSLTLAIPAHAQDAAGDKVNLVIAYDENECPVPTGDEIVICEILVEAERFRIPSNLRTSDSPENKAWAERVESLKILGDFGTHSCSPTGAGALTGCTQKLIDAAYAEKREGSAVRFAQLIAEAREERLSTIDEDAAEQQARVEALEQAYLDRLERERQGPLPGEGQTAETPSTNDLVAPPPQ